jgi:hypothetical protein
MSEPDDQPENFLQRWSRRKHDAEAHAPDDAESAARQTKADANALAPRTPQTDAELPAFDPASLPPIESINALTDIRAFLAPGVPEEITRAALRRAWATDPTIRDFIGIAENQWDFTKPDSVPGFGTLEPTEALRQMVAGLIGDDGPKRALSPPPEKAGPAEQITETSGETALPSPAGEAGHGRPLPHMALDLAAPRENLKDPVQVISQDSNSDAAVQDSLLDVDSIQRSAHRKHGGAVPK